MCIGSISICVEWRNVWEALKLLYEWFLGGIVGVLSFDIPRLESFYTGVMYPVA